MMLEKSGVQGNDPPLAECHSTNAGNRKLCLRTYANLHANNLK